MTLVKVNEEVREKVHKTYGYFYATLSGVDAEKITEDVLSVGKVSEQISLIEKFVHGKISKKKVLEIGSGYGLFVMSGTLDYGADVYGVEPSAEGFGGSFEISQELLKLNSLEQSRIKCGVAEDLPFEDESFDIVYSTNVFEHVDDPKKAFSEAIRVCKSGGIIQIVIPNYGSFYEGHYACWYLPYVSKKVWKIWLKYALHRDPSYADTLQTGLNYFSVRKILRFYEKEGKISVLDYGGGVTIDRITTGEFVPYAGLTKVLRVVTFLRKTGLAFFVSKLLILTKSFSPLIITINKK